MLFPNTRSVSGTLYHSYFTWSRIQEVVTLEVLLRLTEIFIVANIWNTLSQRYTYVGYGLVAYLSISALGGLVKLFPKTKPYLLSWLGSRQNPLRWTEYFFSSSIMVLTVAWLVGIQDLLTLVGLFALNIAMITTGYLLETQKKNQGLWYTLGTLCFAVIWIILGLACRDYVGEYGYGAGIPFLVTFVLFCTFGVNAWLAIEQIGWYKNYYWVDISYVLLSIFSKSALMWTVWYVLQTT